MKSITKKICAFFFVIIFIFVVLVMFKIVKWKMYVWIPDYLSQIASEDKGPVRSHEDIKHIMFMFVDHYEPGRGMKGTEKNLYWLKEYMEMADRHYDSYGRSPQHTWFYAYDHKNEDVVKALANAVYLGYGEIEFHWHHGNDTNETFPEKLKEGLQWFNSFGAMKTVGDDEIVAFGFIHGNWALDNSTVIEHCGVSRELDILKNAGCYADFTFPSFGSDAQPSKINSIYYVQDDDNPKSYGKGKDAEVGKIQREKFMIFEGPLCLAFRREMVECGAVGTDYMPSLSRVDKWISQKIGVRGRPEWIFVKVYTHGIQSRNVFFGKQTDQMFDYLEQKYGTGDYRLHYITSREAYNIVRAAEDGLSDDPDLYRNYEIKEPINKYINCSLPVIYDKVSEGEVVFSPRIVEHSTYLLKISPIVKIDGILNYFNYKKRQNNHMLIVKGNGLLRIYSKQPLIISPNSLPKEKKDLFVYEVHFDES
ncbi:MAG: hypothetical protein ACMUIU_11745 [bacterium]